MSWVTNLIISFDSDDPNVDAIQQWFEENTDSPITPLHRCPEHYGGTKCLETSFLVGAYNYLRLDELLDFLYELEWESPESLQVLVKGEEDDIFTDRIDRSKVKLKSEPPIPPVERFQDPVWAETDKRVNLRTEPNDLEKAMQEMAMKHPHDPQRLAAKLLSLVTVHKSGFTGTGQVTCTDVPVLDTRPGHLPEGKQTTLDNYWVDDADGGQSTLHRGLDLSISPTGSKFVWRIKAWCTQPNINNINSRWVTIWTGHILPTPNKSIGEFYNYAKKMLVDTADRLLDLDPPISSWLGAQSIKYDFWLQDCGDTIAGVTRDNDPNHLCTYWFVLDKKDRHIALNSGCLRGNDEVATEEAKEFALAAAQKKRSRLNPL